MTELCSQPHATYVSRPTVQTRKLSWTESEPVMGSLPSALYGRGLPPELQFPDSFALGLLISVSQWEAVVGDCRMGGVAEPSYFSPLSALGCSLAVAAFPWSQQTLSTRMVVSSCIADVWVAICLFALPTRWWAALPSVEIPLLNDLTLILFSWVRHTFLNKTFSLEEKQCIQLE